MENITEKIRNNAMIAYLFIFINISFLTNKNKVNINNDFVKNHTKTAILIHLWFLINAIIFAYFWLWFNTKLLWYSISDIIAITIFLILFWLLVIWMYRAYNWRTFKIWETLNYKNEAKILDITSNWKFDEKDKLTILLSRIPFVGFIIYPKYKNNSLIESNTKLNLYFSIIFISLYVFWNPNLATLFLLVYIIFIVATAVYLFIQNEIININLSKLPNSHLILNYYKTAKTYFSNYFWNKKEFPNFSEILKLKLEEEKIKNKTSENNLKIKDNFKLKNFIIYIPIINIITLFNLNTKQQKHIINWLLITIIFIIILVLNHFYWLNNNYLLFLLFPITFGYWYLKAGIMNYEIPFLFSIYNIYSWIKNKFKKLFSKAQTLKNTTKEINLKVWNKVKNSETISNNIEK